MRNIVSSAATPGDDVQSDKRNEIQKQDADLVDGHAAIVDGIELRCRQSKPAPVQLVHPVMGQAKGYEPHDQDQVVDDGAPQEEVTEVIHGVSCDNSERNSVYYGTRCPSSPTSRS